METVANQTTLESDPGIGKSGLSEGLVHQADCRKGLQNLSPDSVDLLIADPPYNLSTGNEWSYDTDANLDGMGGDWKKTMEGWDHRPIKEYIGFSLEWLSEAKRVVKPEGSLWLMGSYHNIGALNIALQLLDIEIINDVIWYKRNAFPNLSGRRLTASHETLLWAHTGDNRDYFFNYEWSKAFSPSHDKLKAENKQMRTVWDIPTNKKKWELKYGKHPTQKPVRLLERLICLSSRPGSLVIVPFAGAGSTCIAAKRKGRRTLGFEIDEEYVELANRRLADTEKTRIRDE